LRDDTRSRTPCTAGGPEESDANAAAGALAAEGRGEGAGCGADEVCGVGVGAGAGSCSSKVIYWGKDTVSAAESGESTPKTK
jgi:hypothetical protein